MTGREQARPTLPASCFPVGIPPVDQGPQPSLCLWNPGSGQRLGLSRRGPGIQVQEGSQFCRFRASHPEERGCLLCPQQEKTHGQSMWTGLRLFGVTPGGTVSACRLLHVASAGSFWVQRKGPLGLWTLS